MTYRVTNSVLQARLDSVNRMLGNPPDAPYSTVGVLVLYGAYGGMTVHQYMNEAGGVSDLMGGIFTRREVLLFLNGMVRALELATPAQV